MKKAKLKEKWLPVCLTVLTMLALGILFFNGKFGTIILFVFLLPLYFLPAIIAKERSHSNSSSVFLINAFLGWTLLGWAGVLIWAVVGPPMELGVKCPFCMGVVKEGAQKCRHCGEWLPIRTVKRVVNNEPAAPHRCSR